MSPETRPGGTSLSCVLLALLAGVVAFSAFGQPSRDFSAVEIEVLPVQGSVYMLVGAGGNITVQVGDDGVVVVDSMFAELSGKVLAAIRQLSDQPIRYVVNTHVHGDHTGGNANLARAGSTITGGNVTRAIADSGEGARIVAHENVLLRMTQQEPAVPFDAWPTDTFFTEQKDLFVNGEAVQVLHQPAAHTDGDSLVFFRRSDVISTGDVFVTTLYPFIDRARGGSINGVIDRAQQDHPACGTGGAAGRRDPGHSRTRPNLRRSRCRRVPGHADHHSRPGSAHDRERHEP